MNVEPPLGPVLCHTCNMRAATVFTRGGGCYCRNCTPCMTCHEEKATVFPRGGGGYCRKCTRDFARDRAACERRENRWYCHDCKTAQGHYGRSSRICPQQLAAAIEKVEEHRAEERRATMRNRSARPYIPPPLRVTADVDPEGSEMTVPDAPPEARAPVPTEQTSLEQSSLEQVPPARLPPLVIPAEQSLRMTNRHPRPPPLSSEEMIPAFLREGLTTPRKPVFLLSTSGW